MNGRVGSGLHSFFLSESNSQKKGKVEGLGKGAVGLGAKPPEPKSLGEALGSLGESEPKSPVEETAAATSILMTAGVWCLGFS